MIRSKFRRSLGHRSTSTSFKSSAGIIALIHTITTWHSSHPPPLTPRLFSGTHGYVHEYHATSDKDRPIDLRVCTKGFIIGLWRAWRSARFCLLLGALRDKPVWWRRGSSDQNGYGLPLVYHRTSRFTSRYLKPSARSTLCSSRFSTPIHSYILSHSLALLMSLCAQRDIPHRRQTINAQPLQRPSHRAVRERQAGSRPGLHRADPSKANASVRLISEDTIIFRGDKYVRYRCLLSAHKVSRRVDI